MSQKNEECSCCRICGNKEKHEKNKTQINHSGHEELFKKRFLISFFLSIPVLIYSPTIQDWFNYAPPIFLGSEYIPIFFGTTVFIVGGIPFLKMGVVEARNREPGMMMLISLAIMVAFTYSIFASIFDIGMTLYWELVTLIVIFLLGHWIEMRSVRRASGALDELADLMPEKAEVITSSGDTELVELDKIKEDDLVLVRPGQNIPVDGVVEKGSTKVDQSMITGESNPVRKEPGDKVVGGTLNGDGSLRVRVNATGDKTTLAGIMRLVEDARKTKSKTQVLADRAAGWLFYAAVFMAIITGIAWTISIGFGIDVVERVVTVLVIACPHALGLAIPLVVAINTTIAAKNGILIRDRIASEIARDVDIVVFDKTGTLTVGEQRVIEIKTSPKIGEEEALRMMAAVESDSEHMIAKAITKTAKERNIETPSVENFKAIKGKGVKATYENEEVHVGGENLLKELSVKPTQEITTFSEKAGLNGHTVVYLIQDKEVLAAVSLADKIRDESKDTVEALKIMDIDIALLTGDSEKVAKYVSNELGIKKYFAEVLPEDKDKKIIELQNKGKLVAMVGDGVNDAPALTRADVGIAIGSGTDIAIESADIVLVENNPYDVIRVLNLSKKSYRKMKENLVYAAGYNVFALPLAAGVLAPIGILLSPAIGAILMSASTVIVAINAQRLRTIDL
ncbi:heavy metal translocating P-type ATPase [Methanonatronarchaeum sp. AMET-Sl]|uniref:heavy metal translocating P-type ATPase n=1 Tax=Methanonatronarchaeum sp. AMET-Sl TaxID=3037654 RepID=UPI00244DCDBC|nr:heavy metal translocating P-type ATPase [Methanonatronarchaeum sp. AMET-Sl]WGI17349.1 heavy metal translocating P-type ATPase [Methanonatronarchaeum sp. AMET-Sl]